MGRKSSPSFELSFSPLSFTTLYARHLITSSNKRLAIGDSATNILVCSRYLVPRIISSSTTSLSVRSFKSSGLSRSPVLRLTISKIAIVQFLLGFSSRNFKIPSTFVHPVPRAAFLAITSRFSCRLALRLLLSSLLIQASHRRRLDQSQHL